MKFQNKTILITGGSSGIGLKTAQTFKDEGATVIITASSENSLNETKKEYGDSFHIFKVDVRNIQEIDEFARKIKDQFSKIDILFANAGIALFKPTSEVDEGFFDQHFNINVKGAYFTVSKFLPLINKGGSVILTSSVMGKKGVPGSSVYSATKSALLSFIKVWTSEYASEGIRFNMISPGPIDTPMHGKAGMQGEVLEGYIKAVSELVPIKRFGTTDEVAKAVLFLASSEATYIVGTCLDIDGGYAQV